MRNFIQKTHVALLSFSAAYTGLFALGFAVTLPGSLKRGESVLVPVGFTAIAVFFALMLLIPKATPNWVKNPNGLQHLLANALFLALLPVAFCMPPMFFVMAFSLDTSPTVDIVWILAGIPIVALALSWWLALVLAIWPMPNRRSPALVYNIKV